MGGFATLHTMSNDPVLVRLTQLAMTDEAFHNKFGKIWAMRTMPHLSEEEHNIIEDWAAECFQILLFNLVNPAQMPTVYQEFGLDPLEVMEAMSEVWGDDERRQEMQGSTNIFRVLIKTLLKSGIITDRTKSIYAFYVDMEELKAEGDVMVGDAIADEGIKFLKTINLGRKPFLATAIEG